MEQEQRQWYVMCMTTRNQLMQRELDDMALSGIDVFLPIAEKVTVVKGEKKVFRRPLLTNLFFAKGTEKEISAFVEKVSRRIIFKFQRGGYMKKMIVPFEQMENFKRAIDNSSSHTYLSPEEIVALPKGTRVRITDGPLVNVEGEIVSRKNVGTSLMYISVPGFLVASVEVDAKFLEIID